MSIFKHRFALNLHNTTRSGLRLWISWSVGKSVPEQFHLSTTQAFRPVFAPGVRMGKVVCFGRSMLHADICTHFGLVDLQTVLLFHITNRVVLYTIIISSSIRPFSAKAHDKVERNLLQLKTCFLFKTKQYKAVNNLFFHIRDVINTVITSI